MDCEIYMGQLSNPLAIETRAILKKVGNMDLTCMYPNVLESYQQIASFFSTALWHDVSHHIFHSFADYLPHLTMDCEFHENRNHVCLRHYSIPSAWHIGDAQ